MGLFDDIDFFGVVGPGTVDDPSTTSIFTSLMSWINNFLPTTTTSSDPDSALAFKGFPDSVLSTETALSIMEVLTPFLSFFAPTIAPASDTPSWKSYLTAAGVGIGLILLLIVIIALR